MSGSEPETGLGTADAVRAIEGAVPRLAACLRPALDELHSALGSARLPADDEAEPVEAAGTDGPAGQDPAAHALPEQVAHAPAEPFAGAPSDRVAQAPSEPVTDALSGPSGELAATLADLFAIRTAARLALPVQDASERERIAIALARLLGGGRRDPMPDEAELVRAVRAVAADPLLGDAIPRRIDLAAHVAVRHVLLGGPAPDEAEHVPSEQETRVLSRRMFAFLLDLMLATFLSLLAGIGLGISGVETGAGTERFLGYLALAAIGLMNVHLISTTGSTLGKAVMGLVIVREADGTAPDLELAFRREFPGRFLNQVLFGIGTLAAVGDAMRRTWGDRWVGTVVVRARQPLPLRRHAIVVTSLVGVLSLGLFPGLARLGEVSSALDEASGEEGETVLDLADSLITLATRDVENEEEMQRDLDGILDLAPRARRRSLDVQERAGDYLRQTRLIAPWLTAQAARIDSTYRLATRIVVSAELFALHMQGAREHAADSVQAQRYRLAADFDVSDLVADRELMRRIWRAEGTASGNGGSEDGDE